MMLPLDGYPDLVGESVSLTHRMAEKYLLFFHMCWNLPEIYPRGARESCSLLGLRVVLQCRSRALGKPDVMEEFKGLCWKTACWLGTVVGEDAHSRALRAVTAGPGPGELAEGLVKVWVLRAWCFNNPLQA